MPLYFDVPDSTQIFELLCMIGTSRDIPSWRLRVVHSGRVLSRDASLAQLELRDGDLLTLVVKPASSFVLFGTAGGFVELWDIDECNMIRTFVGHLIDEVITANNGLLGGLGPRKAANMVPTWPPKRS